MNVTNDVYNGLYNGLWTFTISFLYSIGSCINKRPYFYMIKQCLYFYGSCCACKYEHDS